MWGGRNRVGLLALGALLLLLPAPSDAKALVDKARRHARSSPFTSAAAMEFFLLPSAAAGAPPAQPAAEAAAATARQLQDLVSVARNEIPGGI